MEAQEGIAVWVSYNANRDGRRVGDCTIRAIMGATGKSWNSVFWGIVWEAFLQADIMSSNPVWAAYLRRQGFTRHAVPDECPDCYTIEDFAADHPVGDYIVATPGHVVYLHDGDWWDTWDSGGETVTYFWRRG
ncbi:MAG: hypothetical protein E7423_02900 [Ruminococcaceae bacterium]|nr:hypothetical protein [Oscillospiraceae bacterium]